MEKPTPPNQTLLKTIIKKATLTLTKKTLRYLTSIPHSQQPYTRTAPYF